MNESLKITWYGRCCFLVDTGVKKVLFDPYDAYCNVDIGFIEADILISSSTWHDHGHIGASPKAFIISYPGVYEKDRIKITGIEALEDRGSPTVIFNVKVGEFSITNFADFGPEQKEHFNKHVTQENLDIIRSTNIAMARASVIGDPTADHVHDEIFLEYCQPAIIIPEHYFPESFIKQHVSEDQKQNFLTPNSIIDEMVKNIGYAVKEISSYHTEISKNDLNSKFVVKFNDLHPQVQYRA